MQARPLAISKECRQRQAASAQSQSDTPRDNN